jgi:hypothetical protein
MIKALFSAVVVAILLAPFTLKRARVVAAEAVPATEGRTEIVLAGKRSAGSAIKRIIRVEKFERHAD